MKNWTDDWNFQEDFYHLKRKQEIGESSRKNKIRKVKNIEKFYLI